MPAERFYIDVPLQLDQRVEIVDEEFTHLVRVMRAAVGDTIELVNGHNLLASAEIVTIHKRSAEVIIRLLEERAPIEPRLTLAIALPRFSHLEWIIEKGTELGANAFSLFPGERSEKTSLSEQQNHRLRQLMIAALKQCGRLDLPSIEIHPLLKAWQYPPQGTLFFGDVAPEAPPFTPQTKGTQPITFFTGPEKGFSMSETLLLQKTWHAQGVSLSPHILRAETAPILAAGLIRLPS